MRLVLVLLGLLLLFTGLFLALVFRVRSEMTIPFPPAPRTREQAPSWQPCSAEKNAYPAYLEAVAAIVESEGSDDPSVFMEKPQAWVEANARALELLSKAHALPEFQVYPHPPDLDEVSQSETDVRSLWRLASLAMAAASQAWNEGDRRLAERRLLEALTLGQRLRHSPDANLLTASIGRIIVVNWLYVVTRIPPRMRPKLATGLLAGLRCFQPVDPRRILLNHREVVLRSLARPVPPTEFWSPEMHKLASVQRVGDFYSYVAQEMSQAHYTNLIEPLKQFYPKEVLNNDWRGELAVTLHPSDAASWSVLERSDLGHLSLFVVEEPYTENGLRSYAVYLEAGLRGELENGSLIENHTLKLPPDAFAPGHTLQRGEGFMRSCGPDGDDDGDQGVVKEKPDAYDEGEFDNHIELLETNGDLVYWF